LHTIEAVKGLDGENWASAWMGTGARFLKQAEERELAGDVDSAQGAYYQAYGFHFLGRFPCPNHAAKEACYQQELKAYEKFGAMADPPIHPFSIPFDAPHALSSEIRFYLCKPKVVARPPVVIMWGGVDAWKEEMTDSRRRSWPWAQHHPELDGRRIDTAETLQVCPAWS